MDKIKDMIAQALVKYLGDKTPKKKSKKKPVTQEKKSEGISMTQTVNVGHPHPMNEADVALGRMRKQPDWGLLKSGD
jgi:hypothetical protein